MQRYLFLFLLWGMCSRGKPIEQDILTETGITLTGDQAKQTCVHRQQIYIKNTPTCMQIAEQDAQCRTGFQCYYPQVSPAVSYEFLKDDLEEVFEDGDSTGMYIHSVKDTFLFFKAMWKSKVI